MELKFNRKSIVVVILTMYTNARHTPNVFLIFNFKLQKKKYFKVDFFKSSTMLL